jgi:hypothetical protein
MRPGSVRRSGGVDAGLIKVQPYSIPPTIDPATADRSSQAGRRNSARGPDPLHFNACARSAIDKRKAAVDDQGVVASESQIQREEWMNREKTA